MTVSPRYPQASPGNWAVHAACAPYAKELWFPEPFPSVTFAARVQAAKDICGGCPVRQECLQHALHVDERFGIWGGLDAGERRRIRTSRGQVDRLRPAQAACGTSGGYYRHLRGTLTEPCGPCRAAHSAAQRSNRTWSTA